MEAKQVEMLDITKPETQVEVEVQTRPQGYVMYVHVEGMSVLRICQMKDKPLITDDTGQMADYLPAVLQSPDGSLSMERALNQIKELFVSALMDSGDNAVLTASLDDLETMLAAIRRS